MHDSRDLEKATILVRLLLLWRFGELGGGISEFWLLDGRDECLLNPLGMVSEGRLMLSEGRLMLSEGRLMVIEGRLKRNRDRSSMVNCL
jgi:hypothetical protein